MFEPSDLQHGDLILTKETTFWSWAVRKATKSEYSHVGVYNEYTSEVISAVPFSGVISTPLDHASNFAVYRVKGISRLDCRRAVDFCLLRMGRPYDFLHAIVLTWRLITSSLGTASGDVQPESYVCSELIAEAFASIDIFFGNVVDNTLPVTIIESGYTIRCK